MRKDTQDQEDSAISQEDFNKLRLACAAERSLPPPTQSRNTSQLFNYICRGEITTKIDRGSVKKATYTAAHEEAIRKSLARLKEAQEAEKKLYFPTGKSPGEGISKSDDKAFLPRISLGLTRSRTMNSLPTNTDTAQDENREVGERGHNQSSLLSMLRSWTRRGPSEDNPETKRGP